MSERVARYRDYVDPLLDGTDTDLPAYPVYDWLTQGVARATCPPSLSGDLLALADALTVASSDLPPGRARETMGRTALRLRVLAGEVGR